MRKGKNKMEIGLDIERNEMSKINNVVDTRPHYVYYWENLIDGTMYIGKGVDDRITQHIQNINWPCMENTCRKFYNALRKYGVENFKYQIYKYCKSKDEAYTEEHFWITYLKNAGYKLYNIDLGGRRGKNDVMFSDEQHKEICRIYLDEGKSMQKIADELGCSQKSIHNVLKRCGIKRRSISETRKGKPTTTGRKHSEKTKKIISDSRKGKYKFNNEIEKVICAKYNIGASISEIAEQYNCGKTTILHILERNDIKRRSIKESINLYFKRNKKNR